MTISHAELDAAELRTMANRLMLMAEQQEAPDYDPDECEDSSLFDDEALGKLAREEYELRRSRQCFLDDDLFSEPAWDILLDLFASAVEGRKISVTSSCIAAGVPRSTAMRYLTELEERGLVRRNGSEMDGRVNYLTLTPFGCAKLRQALRHYAAMRLRHGQKEPGAATVLKLVR
jgi:DNA-binding transcriptional ArsR family regulator